MPESCSAAFMYFKNMGRQSRETGKKASANLYNSFMRAKLEPSSSVVVETDVVGIDVLPSTADHNGRSETPAPRPARRVGGPQNSYFLLRDDSPHLLQPSAA